MVERRCHVGVAAALAAAVWLGAPAGARAHGLSLFAWTEGTTIRGEAYFIGGGRVRNAKVEVRDASGRRIGEATTDTEGRFQFVASRRAEHRFVLATADGHRAECIVRAADLPASLPGPAVRAKPTTPPPIPATRPMTQPASAPVAGRGEFPAALRREIRQAVRRELTAHEQRTRLRDVIGGIGWILGLAGLAALLRRRRAGQGGREGP